MQNQLGHWLVEPESSISLVLVLWHAQGRIARIAGMDGRVPWSVKSIECSMVPGLRERPG